MYSILELSARSQSNVIPIVVVISLQHLHLPLTFPFFVNGVLQTRTAKPKLYNSGAERQAKLGRKTNLAVNPAKPIGYLY
jgi:hypothetical protein